MRLKLQEATGIDGPEGKAGGQEHVLIKHFHAFRLPVWWDSWKCVGVQPANRGLNYQAFRCWILQEKS